MAVRNPKAPFQQALFSFFSLFSPLLPNFLWHHGGPLFLSLSLLSTELVVVVVVVVFLHILLQSNKIAACLSIRRWSWNNVAHLLENTPAAAAAAVTLFSIP